MPHISQARSSPHVFSKTHTSLVSHLVSVLLHDTWAVFQPPFQAFFLEDVLVQTKYLEEVGVYDGGGGGGGGGGGLLGGVGVGGVEEEEASTFDCIMCGKAGFRCVCAHHIFLFLASL